MSVTTTRNTTRPRRTKTGLASVLAQIAGRGFDPRLTPESYDNIAACGIRSKSLAIAIVATGITVAEHPITLRGLFYRLVSAGFFPSTDKVYYDRLGRLMTHLREVGIVDRRWLVDNVRQTRLMPSWSGLSDFEAAMLDLYQLDFWARFPVYVHVLIEKDNVAGVVASVTDELQVALSPIRGFASVSDASEIGEIWKDVLKPVFAYFLGDFDPSGMELERDVREVAASIREFGFRLFRQVVGRLDPRRRREPQVLVAVLPEAVGQVLSFRGLRHITWPPQSSFAASSRSSSNRPAVRVSRR